MPLRILVFVPFVILIILFLPFRTDGTFLRNLTFVRFFQHPFLCFSPLFSALPDNFCLFLLHLSNALDFAQELGEDIFGRKADIDIAIREVFPAWSAFSV